MAVGDDRDEAVDDRCAGTEIVVTVGSCEGVVADGNETRAVGGDLRLGVDNLHGVRVFQPVGRCRDVEMAY